MQEAPRPRRGRGRRRGAPRPRPTQAPAKPEPSRAAPRPEEPRPARGRGGERPRGERPRADRARRGRGRPRGIAGERPGTRALILLDRREGEPDLTGAPAVFEGYFDPETGERRGPAEGLPRLRSGEERIWGTECWWRFDPAGTGLTPEDHEEIGSAKRLLRGLLRDARRPPAFARKTAT